MSEPLDNNKQAVDIKGYRVLSDLEKAAMNTLKDLEANLLKTIGMMSAMEGTNQRSMSIAVTNIQTGFMWANRAIARPNGE